MSDQDICPEPGCDCELRVNHFEFDAEPSTDRPVRVDSDLVDGAETDWLLPWVPADHLELEPEGPVREEVCLIHGIVG